MVKHLLCGASYSEEPRLYSDVWTLHWQSREKHHVIKKILCAVKEKCKDLWKWVSRRFTNQESMKRLKAMFSRVFNIFTNTAACKTLYLSNTWVRLFYYFQCNLNGACDDFFQM